MVCWESKSSIFIIKSLYSSLANCSMERFLIGIPWVPMKIRFFAWEALWGRIPTLDHLKRGVGACRGDVICVKERRKW